MGLTDAQARWLGHLYHAHARGETLSAYGARQGIALGELLAWERRLRLQGVAVPERHRPGRFVVVAVEA